MNDLSAMVIEYLSVAVAILILLLAALSDLQTREVNDVHWMGIVALATMLSVKEDAADSLLRIMSILTLSLYLFSTRIVGLRAAVVLISVFLMLSEDYLISGDPSVLVILVMVPILLILYHARVIRGGADVKALIVLTLAFPAFPEIHYLLWQPVYPEALVFNPVFTTMVLALLMACLVPLYLLFRGRGDHPDLTSFSMPLDVARSSFVWPVQDHQDGMLVRTRIPDDPAEVYDRLEANGVENVRVTPMIPFIVPIAVGFTATMTLGSPLMLI